MRMRPLTLEKPKPLIQIADKPLLNHIVEALPSEITELVLVVGYKGDTIREYCGDTFLGKPVTYFDQPNPGGQAEALFLAKESLRDTFLVMYADDIHGARALKELVQYPHAMLVARSETPERFGVVEQNDDGTVRRIIEKPEHPPSNLVSTGGFVLSTDIFDCVAEKSHLGEYYLVDNVNIYAQTHPVQVVEQDVWISVGYPEDIAKAEAILAAQKQKIESEKVV